MLPQPQMTHQSAIARPCEYQLSFQTISNERQQELPKANILQIGGVRLQSTWSVNQVNPLQESPQNATFSVVFRSDGTWVTAQLLILDLVVAYQNSGIWLNTKLLDSSSAEVNLKKGTAWERLYQDNTGFIRYFMEKVYPLLKGLESKPNLTAGQLLNRKKNLIVIPHRVFTVLSGFSDLKPNSLGLPNVQWPQNLIQLITEVNSIHQQQPIKKTPSALNQYPSNALVTSPVTNMTASTQLPTAIIRNPFESEKNLPFVSPGVIPVQSPPKLSPHRTDVIQARTNFGGNPFADTGLFQSSKSVILPPTKSTNPFLEETINTRNEPFSFQAPEIKNSMMKKPLAQVPTQVKAQPAPTPVLPVVKPVPAPDSNPFLNDTVVDSKPTQGFLNPQPMILSGLGSIELSQLLPKPQVVQSPTHAPRHVLPQQSPFQNQQDQSARPLSSENAFFRGNSLTLNSNEIAPSMSSQDFQRPVIPYATMETPLSSQAVSLVSSQVNAPPLQKSVMVPPQPQVPKEYIWEVVMKQLTSSSPGTNFPFLDLKPDVFYNKLVLLDEPKDGRMLEQLFKKIGMNPVRQIKDQSQRMQDAVWYLLAAKLFQNFPLKFKEFCKFYRESKEDDDEQKLDEFPNIMKKFLDHNSLVFSNNPQNLKMPFEMLHNLDSSMQPFLRPQIISNLEVTLTRLKVACKPPLHYWLVIKGYTIPYFKETDLKAFQVQVDELSQKDINQFVTVATDVFKEVVNTQQTHRLESLVTRILSRVLITNRWKSADDFLEDIGTDEAHHQRRVEFKTKAVDKMQSQCCLDVDTYLKLLTLLEQHKTKSDIYKEFKKCLHALPDTVSAWFVFRKIKIEQIFKYEGMLDQDELIKWLVALNNLYGFYAKKDRYQADLTGNIQYCWSKLADLTNIKNWLGKILPKLQLSKLTLKRSDWSILLSEMESVELGAIEGVLKKTSFLNSLERAAQLLDIPFMESKLTKRIQNNKSPTYQTTAMNPTFEALVEEYSTDCAELVKQFKNITQLPERGHDFQNWANDIKTSKETFKQILKISQDAPSKTEGKPYPSANVSDWKESWYRYLGKVYNAEEKSLQEVIKDLTAIFPDLQSESSIQKILSQSQLNLQDSNIEDTMAFLINQHQNLRFLVKGFQIIAILDPPNKDSALSKEKHMQDVKNMLITMLVDGDLAFFSITESEINTLKQMLEMQILYQRLTEKRSKPSLMAFVQEILSVVGLNKQVPAEDKIADLKFPLQSNSLLQDLYYYKPDTQNTTTHHKVSKALQALEVNFPNFKRCFQDHKNSGQATETNRAQQILNGSWIIFKLDEQQGDYKIFCTTKQEDIDACLSEDTSLGVPRTTQGSMIQMDAMEDIRVKLTISALDENESSGLRALKIPFCELMRLIKDTHHELTQIYLSGSVYDLNRCLHNSLAKYKQNMGTNQVQVLEQNFNVAVHVKLDKDLGEDFLKTQDPDLKIFNSLATLHSVLSGLRAGTLRDSMVKSDHSEDLPTYTRIRMHLTNQQKRFFCNYVLKNQGSKQLALQDHEQWKSLIKFADGQKYERMINFSFSQFDLETIQDQYKSDTIIDTIARYFAPEETKQKAARDFEFKTLPLYGVYTNSSIEAVFCFIAKRPQFNLDECLKPRYFLALNNQLTTFDLETFLIRAFTDSEPNSHYFMTEYHLLSYDKRQFLLDCLRKYREGQFCRDGTNTNLLILLPSEDSEKVWHEISTASDAIQLTAIADLKAANLKNADEKRRYDKLIERMRVTIVDSEHGGMGKTYWIESKADRQCIVTLLVSGECSKAALDGRLEILDRAMAEVRTRNTQTQDIVLHIKLDMMENMTNNLELVNQFLVQVIALKFVPYKFGYLDLESIKHTYLEVGNTFRYLINQKISIVKIQPEKSKHTVKTLQLYESMRGPSQLSYQELEASKTKIVRDIHVPEGDFQKIDALKLFAMFFHGYKSKDLETKTMRELIHLESKSSDFYRNISTEFAFQQLSQFLQDPEFGSERVNSMSQVQAILKILVYQLCCFEDLHGLNPYNFKVEAKYGFYVSAEQQQAQKSGLVSRTYLLQFIFKNSKSFACSASTDLQREKEKALEIERNQHKKNTLHESEAAKFEKMCEEMMEEYKRLVEQLPAWNRDERTKLTVFMTKGSFGIVYRNFEDVSPYLKHVVRLSERREMEDINKIGFVVGQSKEKLSVLMTGLIRGLDLTTVYRQKGLLQEGLRAANCDIEVLSLQLLEKNSLFFKNKGYVITNDNYLKIMMITQRAQVGLPVVIMGATGCGKTYMIEYIARVLMQDEFYCINLNPGVTESDLINHAETVITLARKNPSSRLWVLFDEFNTSPLQSLVQEIIAARRCSFTSKLGTIPHNIVFVAACNPYRIEPNTSQAGLILEQSKTNLAHRVHPIPDTLLNLVWDFGQLDKQTEEQYITSILETITIKGDLTRPGITRSLELREKEHITFCISVCQNFIRSNESKNSVSLRDVNRFLNLFEFCLANFNISTKAPLVLTIYICYFLRIDSAKLRKQLSDFLQPKLRELGIENVNDEFIKISQEFMEDVKALGVIPADVSVNTPVRENLLATYVAIRKKIPILICGKPGTSKTLSVGICQKIFAADKSLKARSRFFKDCPDLVTINFWGSQNTTCQSITDIFAKAEVLSSRFKDSIVTIVFDEVGLAEISADNPLKVLHPLLEPQESKISFVGLSNWRLDLSKMNRVLFVSRPDPHIDDLNMMNERLGEQNSLLQLAIRCLVQTFKQFRDHQEVELKDVHPNFHGSRDIYNATTQLAHMFKTLMINQEELKEFTKFDVKIKSAKQDEQEESDTHFQQRLLEFCLAMVVQRNFSGINFGTVSSAQKFTMDLGVLMHSEFREWRNKRSTLETKEYDSWIYNTFKDGPQDVVQQYKIGPTDLIFQNLKDENSRHLMILTDNELVEDVLIEHIRGFCEQVQKKPLEKLAVFRGAESKKQELEMISALPKMITTGYTIILKNLDSIYGCLYDLLNQRYEEKNGSKGCYLIYDSHKQWIKIHEEFKCVVLMDREDKRYKSSGIQKRQQPPFLNRFEKYLVLPEDIATPRETEIHKMMQTELLEKKWKTESLLIHNFSKQTLLSLVYDRKEILRHAAESTRGNLPDIFTSIFKDFVRYHQTVIKPMSKSTVQAYKSMVMSSMYRPTPSKEESTDIETERINQLQRMHVLFSKNMILEKLLEAPEERGRYQESFETFRGKFLMSHRHDSLGSLISELMNPFNDCSATAVFTLSPRTTLEDRLKVYPDTVLVKAGDLKKENGKYNLKLKQNSDNKVVFVQFCKRQQWRLLAEIREDLLMLTRDSKNPKNVVVLIHHTLEDLRKRNELYCHIDFSNTDWNMVVIDDLESSGYAEFFDNLDLTCNELVNPEIMPQSQTFCNRTDILKRAVKRGMCNELRTILTTQFKSSHRPSQVSSILSVLENTDSLLSEILLYVIKRADPEVLDTKLSHLIKTQADRQQLQPVLDCQLYVNSLVIDHLRSSIRDGLLAINENVGFRYLDLVAVIPNEEGERRLILETRWRSTLQQTDQADFSDVLPSFSGPEGGFDFQLDDLNGLEGFGANPHSQDPIEWYESIVRDFNYTDLKEGLIKNVDSLQTAVKSLVGGSEKPKPKPSDLFQQIIQVVRNFPEEELEMRMMIFQEPDLLANEQILVASLCVKHLYWTQSKTFGNFSIFSWKLMYRMVSQVLKTTNPTNGSSFSFQKQCLLAIVLAMVFETEIKKLNFATNSPTLNSDDILRQAVQSFENQGFPRVNYNISFEFDVESILKEPSVFKSKEKELRQAILKETNAQSMFKEGLSGRVGNEQQTQQVGGQNSQHNHSILCKEVTLKFMQIIERHRRMVLERIEQNKELIGQLNSQDPIVAVIAIMECLADFFEVLNDPHTRAAIKQTLITIQQFFEDSSVKDTELMTELSHHLLMIIFRLGQDGMNYLTLMLLDMTKKFGIPTNIDDVNSLVAGHSSSVVQFGERYYQKGETFPTSYRIFLLTLKKFTTKHILRGDSSSGLMFSKNGLVKNYSVNTEDVVFGWRNILRNFLERRVSDPGRDVSNKQDNKTLSPSKISFGTEKEKLYVADYEILRDCFNRLQKQLDTYLAGETPPIDIGVVGDMLHLHRVVHLSQEDAEAAKVLNQLILEAGQINFDSMLLAIICRTLNVIIKKNPELSVTRELTAAAEYTAKHQDGASHYSNNFSIVDCGDTVDQLRECMDQLNIIHRGESVFSMDIAVDNQEGSPTKYWEKYLIAFQMITSASFKRMMGTGPNSVVERYINKAVPATRLFAFCAEINATKLPVERQLFVAQTYLFLEAMSQEYHDNWTERFEFCRQVASKVKEGALTLKVVIPQLSSALTSLFDFTLGVVAKVFGQQPRQEVFVDSQLQALSNLDPTTTSWQLRILLQFLARELFNTKHSENQLVRVESLSGMLPTLIMTMVNSIKDNFPSLRVGVQTLAENNKKALNLISTQLAQFLTVQDVEQSGVLLKDQKHAIRDLLFAFSYTESQRKLTHTVVEKNFASQEFAKNRSAASGIRTYLKNKNQLAQAVRLLLHLANASSQVTRASADQLTFEAIARENHDEGNPVLQRTKALVQKWSKSNSVEISAFVQSLGTALDEVSMSINETRLSEVHQQELNMFRNLQGSVPLKLLLSGPKPKEDNKRSFIMDFVNTLIKFITQTADCFERPCTLKSYPDLDQNDLPNLEELDSKHSLLEEWHLIEPRTGKLSDEERGHCDEEYICEIIRKRVFHRMAKIRFENPFYSYAGLKLDKVDIQVRELEAKLKLLGYGGATTPESGGSKEQNKLEGSNRKSQISTGDSKTPTTFNQDHRSEYLKAFGPVLKMYQTMKQAANFEAAQNLDGLFAHLIQIVSKTNPVDADKPLSEIFRAEADSLSESNQATKDFLLNWKVYDLPTIYKAKLAMRFEQDSNKIFPEEDRPNSLHQEMIQAVQSTPEVNADVLHSLIFDLKTKTFSLSCTRTEGISNLNMKEVPLEPYSVTVLDSLLKKAAKKEIKNHKLSSVPSIINALEVSLAKLSKQLQATKF